MYVELFLEYLDKNCELMKAKILELQKKNVFELSIVYIDALGKEELKRYNKIYNIYKCPIVIVNGNGEGHILSLANLEENIIYRLKTKCKGDNLRLAKTNIKIEKKKISSLKDAEFAKDSEGQTFFF